MSTEREPIGVIGTGYVGLVTAAGFAELGNEVWCIDIDAAKIKRLEGGEIPIYEPGLADLVAKHRGRLHFSTDIADALEHARLLFVAVGTPPTYSGDADLSAVHAVVNAMPPSDEHALVMKSTVPVGTGKSIKRIFGEQGKEGFRYVSCPEFLKEGSAVRDFLEPDRVVVGDDGDWAGDAVVDLYAPLGAPLVRTDIASAEMIKLAANAFLATKISFINEIANVCGGHRRQRHRGGQGHRPRRPHRSEVPAGRGWIRWKLLSQRCHRPQAARRQLRLPLPAPQRGHRGQRAAEAPRHGQAREAPRLAGREARSPCSAWPSSPTPTTCARRRRSCSARACRPPGAKVRAYDPVAEDEARKLMPGLEFADNALSAVTGADAAVLVTEWDEFKELDFDAVAEAMSGTLVIDGRNALDPEAVSAAGLTYEGIGRS